MVATVIFITDPERYCPHCQDTGLMREENGHGGTTRARCIYCKAFDRRGLGGDYNLEPRLPALSSGVAT